MVSETYVCNTSHTVVFLKTNGEDTLRRPYKDYSSLNRWQANMNLFSTFTLCNLLPVTTHLRPGKKVSIFPPSDVNLGHIPSRRGLFEDSLYCVVGVAYPSCDESRPCT
jgi:hypothetical protein